nr:hypothetical protein Iba_chr01cCG9470 [Ipomoea batatas]
MEKDKTYGGGVKKWKTKGMKTWSIFGPKAKRESGRFCRISEGVVNLEEEDILVMEETNLFRLLGSAMHITEKCPLSRVENKLKQRVIDIPNPQVVEPSISAGSKSSPEVNGNGGSPDSNEGLESPPKENLVMQDNGKSPDVHVSHESPPKEHSVNLENNPKGKSVASDKGTLRKMVISLFWVVAAACTGVPSRRYANSGSL